MAVTIQLKAAQLYLTRPPFEYEPYVCAHGTWSGARTSKRKYLSEADKNDGWLSFGPYNLPQATDMNADDEMFRVALYTKTKPTGIPDIDIAESALVERNILSGEMAVSVRKLLALPYPSGQDYHVSVGTLYLVERDAIISALMFHARDNPEVMSNPAQALGPQRVADIEKDAQLLATKVVFHIRHRIHDQGAVSSFLRRALPAKRFLYDSKETHEMGRKIFARLEEITMRRFTSMMSPQHQQQGHIPANPNEPIAEFLHLARGDGPYGPQPPLAYTLQDILVRFSGKAASNQEPDLLGTDQTLDTMALQLMAALLRHGMTTTDFVDIVKKQFAEPHSSPGSFFPDPQPPGRWPRRNPPTLPPPYFSGQPAGRPH